MAGFWKKITSGLDWWNQEENQGQREQYAREDAEEEERRKREAAARAAMQTNQPRPGSVVTPNQPRPVSDPMQLFDPGKPLYKVGGSQSQFNTALNKATEQPAPEVKPNPQQEIERLTQENMDQAIKEEKGRTSWFDRQVMDRDWIERAKITARNRAAMQYQEKYGFNKQPEVQAVMQQNREMGNKLSENSQRMGAALDSVEDDLMKVGQVASYVPVTGSVLNLGLAGSEKLAKATGNDAYGEDLDDMRIRMDLGMKRDEFDALPEDTRQKLRLLQTVGLAAAPLDFLGVGGLAKSGVVTAGKKAALEFAEEGAVDFATKQALKKAALSEAKATIAPAVIGAGISVGGQAYLGGTGNIDEGEAAKTGLLTAGTSLLFPSQGIRNSADDAIEDAAKNLDFGEIPDIPGALKKAEGAAEEAVDLGDGLSSTNLAKVAREGEEGLEDVTARPVTATEAGDADPTTRPIDVPAPEPRPRPNVPDVTNPIVLGKAADGTPVTGPPPAPELPVMADFNDTINTPLIKAQPAPVAAPVAAPNTADIAEAAGQGDLRVSTDVDAAGNPTMVSDARVARELEDAGLAPQRGDSPVASNEEALLQAAERAAREEVNLDTPAPRTRQQLINRIEDDEVRTALVENAPPKDKVVLAEAEDRARSVVNNAKDEDLILTYSKPHKMETPDDLFQALAASRRLQGIDDDGARLAVRNITDSIAEQSSKSGLWQRASQVLFENMPTEMKQNYLIDKIENSTGAKMNDADRSTLLTLVDNADASTDQLRMLEAEANKILESGAINNAGTDPKVLARAGELQEAIKKGTREKEMRQFEAWKFYQENLPKDTLGARAANVGRTMMLSSPTGRVFDLASTAMTTADDIATRGVSNLIGKVLNKVPGVKPGTFKDTAFSPKKFIQGGVEGAKDIIDSFKGKGRTEDFMGAAQKSTRGDVNTGGSVVRRTVRTLTEAPTNLTRGLRDDALFREGMQEAAKQGLKGADQEAYAGLRAAVPSAEQFEAAVQTHMKANMLHNNGISRWLNGLAQKLDSKGSGWAAPIIRNQVAPFTSWVGGNMHRTLTDKNVLWNVGGIAVEAKRGNMQGVIDNVSKLAVNSAEAYAAGYLLTQAGVLTTTDANGDSYGGVYFHIGDRYIPVAIAGTVAVPIILGNAISQGQQAVEEGGDGQEMVSAFTKAVSSNTLKNMGVASVFGGENNLQSTIATASSENGDPVGAAAEFTGNLVRQYIPGASSDINAGLDYTNLNPTHEAAETKVTKENPETGRQKTDVIQTEINKTKNKIPFLSQGLDRKDGVPAKDVIDRITKGTHETDEMAGKRETAESLKDMEMRLRRDGVPLTDDAIQARLEDGEYEKAITGLQYKLAAAETDPDIPKSRKEKIRDEITKATLQSQGVPVDTDGIKARTEEGDYEKAMLGLSYQLKVAKGDPNTPQSKRDEIESDITRLKVTQDGKYPPAVIAMYSDTSQSEWRQLGDPDSEDYDPDLYQLLYSYDSALAKEGVSRSTKSGKKNKYNSAAGGRGGKGRGSNFSADIGTLTFNGPNFSPLKAQSATFGAPQSAIPVIERVPNYDRSKLKKISVTKGGQVT